MKLCWYCLGGRGWLMDPVAGWRRIPCFVCNPDGRDEDIYLTDIPEASEEFFKKARLIIPRK